MNNENQTPKRWKLRSEFIGIVEVFNAVLLTLTGFAIAKGDTVWAIAINCLYAAGKNFVERTLPVNKYEDEKTV